MALVDSAASEDDINQNAPALVELAESANRAARDLIIDGIAALGTREGRTREDGGRDYFSYLRISTALGALFDANGGSRTDRYESAAKLLGRHSAVTGKRRARLLCSCLAGSIREVCTPRNGPGATEDKGLAAVAATFLSSEPAAEPNRFGEAVICEREVWSRMARLIFDSSRVTITGIVPVQLILALQDEWADGEPPNDALTISYVTRPQRHVYDGIRTLDGHRLWQSWTAGLTGLRNLVKLLPHAADSPVDMYRFALSSDEVGTNCVIQCTKRAGSWEVRTIVLTPIGPSRRFSARYAVSELTSRDDAVIDWLADISRAARPIQMREIECRTPAAPIRPVESTFVAPEVLGQKPSGVPTHDCVKPVALLIPRGTNRDGPTVLLKMRSELSHNDDFGKLSLISARILEEDLAAGLAVDPLVEENPNLALDSLWIAAGSPHPFVVPKESFAWAAQREAFWTTHLELDVGTFTFRGTHFIQREEDPTVWLQFVALTVDLDRRAMADAMNFDSEGVREVLVSTLYEQGLPLNRFLMNRRDWLLDHCFGSD
jgi:hypothetical protein